MTTNKKTLIGFIGQGFIGKNYSDELEERGFTVIRYAQGEEFAKNKEKIATCDIVFIAVPTPTTPEGFDYSIVKSVLSLIGKGKVAVVKSTLLPGTTELLQRDFPGVFILHSPEFLRVVTATHDSRFPDRNIVGIPVISDEYENKAREVLSVLPQAPYEKICSSREAELTKYFGNIFLYTKVIFMNLAYDLSNELGADWNVVSEALSNDPRIGKSHLNPVHDGGRGAGGLCFIKDFEAFLQLYEDTVKDEKGLEVLKSLREKNKELLMSSGKDSDIFEGVYGKKK